MEKTSLCRGELLLEKRGGQALDDHPNLETVKSYQCDQACVMRTDYPLAKKESIKPDDLLGERVISSPESVPFGRTLNTPSEPPARRCTRISNA